MIVTFLSKETLLRINRIALTSFRISSNNRKNILNSRNVKAKKIQRCHESEDRVRKNLLSMSKKKRRFLRSSKLFNSLNLKMMNCLKSTQC